MANGRKTPRHFNPPPMFGLRAKLSRTAQAIAVMLNAAGERGIEVERIPLLLYMADLFGWQYLGRPITDIRWRRKHLAVRTTSHITEP